MTGRFRVDTGGSSNPFSRVRVGGRSDFVDASGKDIDNLPSMIRTSLAGE